MKMWKSIYLFFFLSFIVFCRAQVSPQNTQVEFQISQFGTVAGTPLIARILPRDANNNTITGCQLGTTPFSATSPSAALDIIYPNVCQPNVQFPYVITLVANTAGNYSVSFLYQNQLLGLSPYTIGFTFGSISPNNSVAVGPGLGVATVGENATFYFKTYDQHNNLIEKCLDPSQWSDFTIKLTQPSIIYGNVLSCDNTSFVYTANYYTTSTDSGFLYVQYFGNNFNNMPRTPVIYSGPPYGPTCNLPAATNLNTTEAGVPSTFVLDCVDQYGNPLSECSHFPLDKWVADYVSTQDSTTFNTSMVTCQESGIYTFTYNDTHAALYNTNVYYGSMNNSVPQFTTLITPGPANDIKAQGPGVEYNNPANIAGQTVLFSILAADQYGNTISKCLNSSDSDWIIQAFPEMQIPPQPPICAGGVMISNWTATQANLDYFVTVEYNGKAAEGSPYLTDVFPNTLDGSQAILQDLAKTQVGAGLPLPFSIKGYDKYGNEIVNCSSVDVTLFLAKATNLQNTSITITGSVSCIQLEQSVVLNGTVYGTLIGQYSLAVYYNNVQLQNSPQIFVVNPGPMFAPLSYATGYAFTNKTEVAAGSTNYFFIHQRDQYGNVISSCLGLGYEWNVIVEINPPIKKLTNQTFEGSCDNQGVYTLPLTVTKTGTYDVIVYSILNLNYSGEVSILNNGTVTVVPGPFSASESVVSVQAFATVGDHPEVTVTPYDQYGNLISTCSITTANRLEIFAHLGLFISTTGSMACSGIIYTGNYLANYTGNYTVDVGLGPSIAVGRTGYTNVENGVFDPTFSTAFGPGVGLPPTNITAGTNGTFYIVPVNKNGFLIPPQYANLSAFNFMIMGVQDPETMINNTVFNGYTAQGYLEFYYNGTKAQDYHINITYSASASQLANEKGYYSATIVANVIVLSTLQASNITSDDSGTGSFDLSATDAFGNPVVLTNLDASLSPSCSFPNVSCIPYSQPYTCDFSVQESGVYCITVTNTTSFAQYSLDSILVQGGAGCSEELESCSGNGVCYSDDSGKYQCNCKDGYTGNNCNTKIKSKYMNLWLGVGLLIGLSILLLIIGVVIGCLLGRRNRGNRNLLN